MNELQQCPFCGYALPVDEGLCEATYNEEGLLASPFVVVCPNCGSGGCPGDSREEAISKWNKRANPNE